MNALPVFGRTMPAHLRGELRRSWREHLPLVLCGAVMTVLLVALAAGIALDPRQVINEPVWLKPAKFAISIAIYTLSLVWLLRFIDGHRRLVLGASWVIAGALLVEEAIISFQALRGVRSHFNFTTTFDTVLWGTMGGAIMLLWLANAVVAVLLLRQRFANPVLAWGLRLGLLVAMFGMAVAFLMPTASNGGAHAVGVADGGPGLPLLGWSTVGGDLRVPHFVGLHALQVLPLVAWLLMALPVPWLNTRDRKHLMVTAGIAYFGLVAGLTWQALRGQPLIAPDALTNIVALALAGVVGLATAAILVRARLRRLVGVPSLTAAG